MKINLIIQLNKLFILSVVVLYILLFSVQASSAESTPMKSDRYLGLEREIINQLNQERVDHDLVALQFDNTLRKAATLKLEDMVRKKYFSHTSPDGKTPWYWFEQVGYDYKFAGENLATKFTTAGEVHEAWMKSKTHRENILFPKYKDVAVVVGENIDGELIAVELFGRKIGDNGPLVSGKTSSKKEEVIDNVVSTVSTSIIPNEAKVINEITGYDISFNNLILLLVSGMCLLLVINVWILEKEEEKIILELKKVS